MCIVVEIDEAARATDRITAPGGGLITGIEGRHGIVPHLDVALRRIGTRHHRRERGTVRGVEPQRSVPVRGREARHHMQQRVTGTRGDGHALAVDEQPAPVTHGAAIIERELIDRDASRRLERIYRQRRHPRQVVPECLRMLRHPPCLAISPPPERRRACQYR